MVLWPRGRNRQYARADTFIGQAFGVARDSRPGFSWVTEEQNVTSEILDLVRRHGHTVFGRTSLNQSVPGFLNKKTDDVDAFTPHGARDASIITRQLNDEYGRGHFAQKPGIYPGVRKVQDVVHNRNVADFVPSAPEGRVPSRNIDGVRYSTIGFEAKKRRAILRDQNARYRWDSAREDLTRIRATRRFNSLR